jgi:CrcB protein
MVPPAVLVGTGGAIGAMSRYAIGQWLLHERFPIGTLTVNVVGSFVLGLVTFAGLSTETVLFVGVGACGSFTTYSSFSFETVRLWETGDRLRASVYAFGTLGLCLVAAGTGMLCATLLSG